MRVLLAMLLLLFTVTPAQAEPVGPAWAGVRSSPYGPGGGFPSQQTWGGYINKMTGYFPGAGGIGLSIVGALNGRGMKLEFPKPSGTYPNITFQSSDKHEEVPEVLRRQQHQGVAEPRDPASRGVDQLIDLSLNR